MPAEGIVDGDNKVFSLLQESRWNEAVQQAKQNPKLTKNLFTVTRFYDNEISSQVNALHMAAALGAPGEVIQRLADINPSALSQPDKKYGRIPLHIAVMSGAPPETVSILISLDPKTTPRHRDNNGRIPLHYACKEPNYCEFSTRLLLRSYPEGARVADDSGFIPLHVACRYGPSLNVVRMLIRGAPDTLSMKTRKGSTPIMCARGSKGGLGEEIVGILERFAEEHAASSRN